ncbi:MAG: vitamin K epoxide reductase family protein [Candidatus Pacebacteria bacterium]|nr:vitamin K epoxide reductase family protein [Candidatus Paceibacterota bacterium]
MSLFIAILACLFGIGLSGWMYLKKKRHQSLSCPRDNPCDLVLHSHFSKTFGLPNEILGIIYFSLVLVLIFLPLIGFSAVWDLYILFFLVLFGGLFSVYLIGLQAFVIRAWCLWCLGIAFVNLILIFSLSGIPTEVFAHVLASQKTLWVIIHNIGFILGVGSATITDVFFFRFLKDNTISAQEKGTMDTLTNIIWVGLGILIVSGLALFIPNQVDLAVSSKFLLKVVVVGVIIFNGIALNMFIAPHMRRLSFEGTKPAKRFRRFAFALGGISITSWYLAFILGSLRNIPINFNFALWAYLTILISVIIGSQIAERKITKQHSIFKVSEDLD